MKLEDVLALHPKGADSATLRTAIEKAETLRSDLLVRAVELDRTRATGLLTLEAKTILKAEQVAAEARLDADRIQALLPAIHADLHAAEGREAIEGLRQEAEQVSRLVAEQQAWLTANLPELQRLQDEQTRLAGEHAALRDAAKQARAALLTNIEAAYAREAVRDAGPISFEIPELIA